MTRGAGILMFNGLALYYDQSGVRSVVSLPTEQTGDDFFGRIGETSKGSPVGELTVQPTGQIKSLAKLYPYGPAVIEGVTRGWYAGQSIYGSVGYNHTKAGLKTLYAKIGITKSPTLIISPRRQIFGPMSFRYIKKTSGPTQPTAADALKTISSTAFNDASFDETTIVKEIPTLSLGARTSPLDAIGCRSGIEIEPIYEITEVDDDNVGSYEATVDSVAWRCRFAANNLTEAQFDELCNWQGADAHIAGQDIGFLNEDLIIDSDFLTVTLHNVGVVRGENGFGVKVDRNGMIEMVSSMAFTAGAPDPLITMTIN